MKAVNVMMWVNICGFAAAVLGVVLNQRLLVVGGLLTFVIALVITAQLDALHTRQLHRAGEFELGR